MSKCPYLWTSDASASSTSKRPHPKECPLSCDQTALTAPLPDKLVRWAPSRAYFESLASYEKLPTFSLRGVWKGKFLLGGGRTTKFATWMRRFASMHHDCGFWFLLVRVVRRWTVWLQTSLSFRIGLLCAQSKTLSSCPTEQSSQQIPSSCDRTTFGYPLTSGATPP